MTPQEEIDNLVPPWKLTDAAWDLVLEENEESPEVKEALKTLLQSVVDDAWQYTRKEVENARRRLEDLK